MNVAGRNRRKTIAEINVVPYIDVMLVLLVIFMITAPLLTQGVKVDLPQATAKAIPDKEQDPLIVSVDSRGSFYLNIGSTPGQSLDANTLATRVAAELQLSQKQAKPRQVLVKGDKNVDYGKIMQAMVILQAAGAPSVGLITEPPPS